MTDMGSRLKKLRINSNLTQKQLADRIGLANSAISSYESGYRYPSYDILLKYSRIFHVSTDYLIGSENNNVIDVSGLNQDQIDVVQHVIEVFRNK